MLSKELEQLSVQLTSPKMKVFICFVAVFVAAVVAQNAHITYTTMNGTEDPYHSVNMTIGAPGSTFFEVMRFQGWLFPKHWAIKYEENAEGGKVITSIGGLANNPSEFGAWVLYMIPYYPVELIVPDDEFIVTQSVDTIAIEDNQNFLFVYREVKH